MATGKFEQAHGGTLLLDEVGDMSLETQAKLLRVLEAGEIERVGGRKTIPVDVRVISATNKNPRDEVAAGRFREDLFFRLAVVPIEVPPLREREDDVLLIADHFLKCCAAEYGRAVRRFSPEARAVVRRHSWPGNVRELRNAMERAVILGASGAEISESEARRLIDLAPVSGGAPRVGASGGGAFAGGAPSGGASGGGASTAPLDAAGASGSPPAIAPVSSDAASASIAAGSAPEPQGAANRRSLSGALDQLERDLIEGALARHRGNVAEAARELEIDRANLHRKMRRLGITRAKGGAPDGTE
jgi:DNA-binding NtrC family response regulator